MTKAQQALRNQEILIILRNIQYKNWNFWVKTTKKHSTVWVEFMDSTGQEWKSRKYIVSHHATKSEIVQTMFLAVKIAEEHEMREAFKYKGCAIFGPHFDIEVLSNIPLEVRT